MKRILYTIMLALGLTCLVGCSNEARKGGEDSFTAKVLQVDETSVLVEQILDEGKAGKYRFSKENLKNADQIMVNDIISVYYSGIVEESDPAGIDVFNWDLVKRPEVTHSQVSTRKKNDGKRVVMLDDKIYVDTGEVANIPRCGTPDFTFDYTVKKGEPKKNGETNFGKGYKGQWGVLRSNRIDINIDNEWCSFAYNENNLYIKS